MRLLLMSICVLFLVGCLHSVKHPFDGNKPPVAKIKVTSGGCNLIQGEGK